MNSLIFFHVGFFFVEFINIKYKNSNDIVQRIRDGRRVRNNLGEMPILSGMLYCADCGKKLYQVRGKGWNHDKEFLVCASYRKHKVMCTSHQIKNMQV
ncbi:zinc ribbon domain-containing protein [Mageeibacillus indolicus]|uniref:zinc ribbon domain-containing protein n=2 Tax=Mageeibacillus indolicus TaxID=884684 RepID=UPI001FA8D831|nr:zinc ribbon domain-containing protein [Mageeibacillus indolicus]